ncbi:MAG: lysine--tRNA ligase [Alphaproteobacteria bacterium]|nr:MAG: lysine--tRNA ligase [Alphaproteobacteria bacterium]
MKNAKKVIEKNTSGLITLKTGYGPSGLPHLGTIAEVIRTRMLQQAIELQGRKSKIVTFIDNMDGFRKVPTNLPNQDYLKQFLGMPLFKVPDVFGCCDSFADHNINELNKLINKFGLTEYVEVVKSSDMYISGKFNDAILLVLQNYKKILEVMLPTLGSERQQTYSPFLPISQKSGKVLEVKIEEYKVGEGKIVFYDEGELVEQAVTNGKCKLQWKVDWAMQWHALKIDYEMYGKDLIDSFAVAKPICRILGSQEPVNMVYELFLASDNKKISKSKGNGVSLSDWMQFAPIASMKHFLFLNPERAKKLDIKDLPRYVDAYLHDLKRYHIQLNEKDELIHNNPIFYVHGTQDIPEATDLSYSLLLNIQSGLRSPDYETFISFLQKQKSNLNDTELKLARAVYNYSIYHSNNETVPPPKWIKKYLHIFIEEIKELETGLDMQTKLYDLGNQAVANGDIENLKLWFENIYLVLFNEKSGPRLGPFFELYGKERSVELIKSKLNEDR